MIVLWISASFLLLAWASFIYIFNKCLLHIILNVKLLCPDNKTHIASGYFKAQIFLDVSMKETEASKTNQLNKSLQEYSNYISIIRIVIVANSSCL